MLKLIQELPDDKDIVIFDHRKCRDDDDGSGSSEGIYHDFTVESYTADEIENGSIPYSALVFDNPDLEP